MGPEETNKRYKKINANNIEKIFFFIFMIPKVAKKTIIANQINPIELKITFDVS